MPHVAFILPLLAGCEQWNDVKDVIDDLTDPIVVEALLLGAVEPDSPYIDLSDTPFADGTALKVFLADATDLESLEAGALDGATVNVLAPSLGSMALEADGGGLYTLYGSAGLEYFAGEEYALSAVTGDVTHRAVLSAPHPPDTSIPATQPVGQPLAVDLSAFGYDNLLVAVYDVQGEAITYSNEPQGIEELYDFTHSGEAVKRHEIPGSAFPRQGIYAVGVAGMQSADEDAFTEMNTGLSSFLAGQMSFYAVQAQ